MARPSEELSAIAQCFEAQYKYAFVLCERGEREKAEALFLEMLMEPALGKLHRAGFHSILAYGLDETLEHAKRASHLYKTLYDDSASKHGSDAQAILDTILKAEYESESDEEPDGGEETAESSSASKAMGIPSASTNEPRQQNAEPYGSLDAPPTYTATTAESERRQSVASDVDAEPGDPKSHVSGRIKRSKTDDATSEESHVDDQTAVSPILTTSETTC